LVAKLEGKRPLGRPRHRWVGNIKMYLGEIRWGSVDWIGLDKDKVDWKALVNAIKNFRVPKNAGKISSGCTTGCLSISAQLRRVCWSLDIFTHNRDCKFTVE
jgi:hypothetical protein